MGGSPLRRRFAGAKLDRPRDEAKELLDEMVVSRVCRRAARDDCQPLGLNQDLDLEAFTNLSATEAIATTVSDGSP